MSTVIANSITGKELFLFGDTLVTHIGGFTQNSSSPLSGVTSHGEIFQPISHNGQILAFTESACKVGILNSHFLMGIAGDADFAYSILDYLFLNKDLILSFQILSQKLQLSTFNISPSNKSQGTCAEILFCSNSLQIIRSKFEVIDNGEIKFSIDTNTVSPSQAFQIVIGSGAQYIKNHFPLEIGRSCSVDPSLLSVATQMLCMEYSRVLRIGTQNQALTVGGAFLGFEISEQGVRIPRDTIYFFVNPNGVASYITKIAYSNELFIVTDFLRKSVTVVRTIEGELNYRTAPVVGNTDITELLKYSCSFQAPVNFVSYYEQDTDEHPVISIIENSSDSAISNAPPTGLAWIDPNQEMTLTFASGKSIIIKIP